MKKLFFLCAFLFMSLQIQAQLYIVSVQVNGGDIIISAPDGTITTVDPLPSPSGLSGNMGTIESVNAILNDIIAQGFKLISVSKNNARAGIAGVDYVNDYNIENSIFYLAVP